MLSECNNVFESIEGSLSKRMVAIKKYQALLAMIQNDKRASEVVIDVLRHLGICYLNIGNYAAAGANFASAWSLCSTSTQKDLKKDIAYQIAQCKEEDGDLEGALDWYKLVCDSFGMFSTCLEGVRRIERKMGKNSGIFPRQPKINTREEESLVKEFQDMLPTNEKRSIAETMKRCDHCSRGGIKLLLCKGCANDQEAPSTNYCKYSRFQEWFCVAHSSNSIQSKSTSY